MNEAPAPTAPITGRDLWARYKRVPILALVGGLLAFMASFVVPASYQSSTSVLLRGRESTLLTGNGSDLSGQPGVLDSSLAATLSETQGALVSSRAVAEEVVDRLDLDDPKPKDPGVVGWAKRTFATTYKWTRAVVTFGFYKEAERREAAIRQVMEGLGASQVDDSYVLKISAAYDDPDIAADIANTAADVMLELSAARSEAESAGYRDFLAAQLDSALADEAAAATQVAQFKAANGITDVDRELELSSESKETLSRQLADVEAQLDAAEAQAASLRASLARLSPNQTNNTRIETGRSSTDIGTTSASSAYERTLASVQEAEAEASGLRAQRDALQATLSGATTAAEPLTGQEAELRQLELKRDIAAGTVASLSEQHQAAVLDSEQAPIELTRLDEAAPSTYPVSPIRYLYLALGMVLGAVGGFLLSELRLRRARYLALVDAGLGRTDVADRLDLSDHATLSNGDATVVAAAQTSGERLSDE